jgi:hypothetical protein
MQLANKFRWEKHSISIETDIVEFFGAIFGWYVYHVLSGFGIDSPVLTRTIYRSPKFQGTNDEVCDTLLLWSNTAVLFEAKGMRLTTRQESGISVADTLKAIDGMLGDKKSGTGQLAKSIQRILDGQVVVAENSVADIRACGTIIPAIVVYDESLGNHAVRNHLQARFAQQLSRSGTISDSIGPLLLLTTRDIELLERLALA